MTLLRRILWLLGWGMAGGLIGVFLLGYAAPFLSPSHFWWTDLIAVFLPPSSLAVGILSLVLGAQGVYRRGWGRVVLSAVLLVLIAVRFGPRLAAWTPPSPSGDELRVMSFNVPPSYKNNHSPSPALAEFVSREEPHILAFQESRIQTKRESQTELTNVSPTIQQVLDDSTRYAPPRVLPPNTDIKQPVIGRLAIDSMTIHDLPGGTGTDARSRYTRIHFTWQGRSAVLYNIHLHTVGQSRPWTLLEAWPSPARWRRFLRTYRDGALRRAQQARLLRRRIEREPRPVIVVGDFNSTPHQWAYRHLAQGLENAVSRRARGWSATFPSHYPLVRIDHILTDPSWQVVAARIPSSPDGPEVSDHRPVVADIRWKGE